MMTLAVLATFEVTLVRKIYLTEQNLTKMGTEYCVPHLIEFEFIGNIIKSIIFIKKLILLIKIKILLDIYN